ncbi:MAG: hypothetical protein MUO25_00100 [Thermoanaerobaculaceae bacterium]|nr:hypothetical protein [Thermoanaerobaculaceae bacterium]
MKLPIQSARFERWWPILLGLVACLLTLPALRAGLIGDDYFHRAVLLHRGEVAPFMRPVMDLFAFVKPGEPAELMRRVGYLPWWSDPGVRISLFRPITALTHMLDYTLWPDGIVLQHLHSLGWFFLGVFLVAALYRRVPDMPVAAAALAGLFFAVEDAHTYPAGWLANRNALLCLVCGTAALICHVRWRASGRTRWLALGLLLFSVGLGCGEATLGALGYVVAWQLTMEPKQARIRSTAVLLPYLGLVFLWRLLYDTLGYGVAGSRLYVDPGQRPLLFLQALAERWPVLLAGQWFQIPIDLWILLTWPQRLALWVASVALAAGVVWLFWPLLKRPIARFWAIGMALSIVPLCAAFPMERLLIFSGIGGFGLLALFVDSYVFSSPVSSRWRRSAAIALLVLHGPIAAVLLVGQTFGLPMLGDFFTAAARHSPGGPEIAHQTFVYVNGNDFPVVYSRVVRIANGDPAPRRVAQLASMTDTNRIYRKDRYTLVITPADGFLARPVDRLFASGNRRFDSGDRIDRPDYQAEVLSVTRDGRPASVSFQFRHPLEDPSLRWLYWKDRRLLEFPLPEVGSSVLLSGNSFSPF